MNSRVPHISGTNARRQIGVITLAVSMAVTLAVPVVSARPVDPRAAAPEISLTIFVDGERVSGSGPTLVAGDDVTFTYFIENTGSVAVEKIKVFDPARSAAECSDLRIEPGDTVECITTGLVGEGEYAEKGIVRVWDGAGRRIQAGRWIRYVGEVPLVPAELSVVVSAGGKEAGVAPGPRMRAGRTVGWSVEVTNTGDDHLWGVFAYDRDLGTMECGTPRLAPGQSTSCTVSGRIELGPIEGRIKVTAWATDGRELTESIERYALGFVKGPNITVETTVDGFDGDSHAGPRRVVGEDLDFDYLVYNTGSLPLSKVGVWDPMFGRVDCPSNTLDKGESMTCSHTITAELGWWNTIGYARGWNADEVVRDSDKTFWHVRTTARVSEIGLTITVDGRDASEAPGPQIQSGRTVRVVYRMVNQGNTPLWSIEVRHWDASSMTCTGNRDPQAGQVYVCGAELRVTEGAHWDDVQAVAWNSDGTKIVAEQRIYYTGS